MRLFVAIQFSGRIKKALITAQNSLRRYALGGNFTSADNLHLTLAFIGETDNADGAIRALEGVNSPPFDLTVGGSGCFGDLWWAGVESPPELSLLASAVQSALRREGFDIERRAWKPHITLVRQIRAKAPIRLEIPRITMTVEKIALMSSERAGGRLVYREMYARSLMR